MERKYFASAWNDIKHSPGWFGKLCLLALVNFIPVFGQAVTLGYLYGWAREIAWGVHGPMPRSIFSNEDGKFWRRAWYVLGVTVVFSFIPTLLSSIGSTMETSETVFTFFGPQVVFNPVLSTIASLCSFVGFLLALVVFMPAGVAAMRVAIYDRFSAGFQFEKILKMMRHDFKGIMRIFGMYILMGMIVSVIACILVFVIFFGLIVAIVFSAAGPAGVGSFNPEMLQYYSPQEQLYLLGRILLAGGFFVVLLLLAVIWLILVAGVFIQAVFCRALGYWVMQFDVPMWGGQDDPMPFELMEDPARKASVAPPVAPTSSPASATEAASTVTTEPSPSATSETMPAASSDVAPASKVVSDLASSFGNAQSAHGVQNGNEGNANIGEDR